MSKIVALSEAASIALHGIILIARSKKTMNVVEIAVSTQSSKHHVAKVLQRLVKEGYLNSNRGPSGGFSLKVPTNEITLLDIYEAIEGKIQISECPVEKQICPFDKCIMNNVTKKMTEEFQKYLQSQTLEDYL